MINLFIDLDSTLIYSHRHKFSGEELIPAEYIDGKLQSYMTRKTFDFLSEHNDINVIPVTARAQPQYARLEGVLKKFRCEYAIICRGAMLLKNGVPDEKWLAETLDCAGEEIAELPKAEKWYRDKFAEEDIHITENILIYARAENPEAAAEELKSAVNSSLLNIHYDSRKVYCIPVSINKGNAVKRFADYSGLSIDAAAGDDTPDISMLENAKIAFLPKWLSDKVEGPTKEVWNENGCFSDFICDRLEKIIVGK